MSFLRTRTLLAGILLAGGAVLALPAPAWAHTELLGTSPADAAAVTSPLDEVTLTFSGPVRADGSTVTVTGPDGRSHSDGAVAVIDFVVHQPVTGLTSGTYRVDWVVVAGDGHPISGEFTFELSLPAGPSAAPSPQATAVVTATTDAPPSTVVAEHRAFGGWWWLALLLALGLAALVGLLVLRRRRSP